MGIVAGACCNFATKRKDIFVYISKVLICLANNNSFSEVPFPNRRCSRSLRRTRRRRDYRPALQWVFRKVGYHRLGWYQHKRRRWLDRSQLEAAVQAVRIHLRRLRVRVCCDGHHREERGHGPWLAIACFGRSRRVGHGRGSGTADTFGVERGCFFP